MTIQVNIGAAKTRLSELVAASERGEEVVLARDGKPVVRLVVVNEAIDPQQARAQRMALFGRLRGAISADIDWTESPFSETELDRFEKPF